MENLYSGHSQLFGRNFGIRNWRYFGYARKRCWSVGSGGWTADYGLLACLCHRHPDSYYTHGKNGSKKAYAVGSGIIFVGNLFTVTSTGYSMLSYSDDCFGRHFGVGLFMGSASTIKWTGPSVMLAYAIVGIFIFFIMRAMGEMQYIEPSTGSFAIFGYKYIHPLAGYATAWSNWFQWVVVGMSEPLSLIINNGKNFVYFVAEAGG